MGAIKDIVDLCIQLRNETSNREVAEAIAKIQSVTLALQSEQASISEKNAQLVHENYELQRKLTQLETVHSHTIAQMQESHRNELAKHAAKSSILGAELSDETRKILKYAFDKGQDFSDNEIARRFQMAQSMAEYHSDTLFKNKFITQTRVGFNGSPPMYGLTPQGRKYAVENC